VLRKASSFIAVLAVLTAGAYVYAQRLSRLDSWELEFSSKPPRVVELRDDSRIEPYTYIVYEVTNTTQDTVDFYPIFEIETPDGEVTRSSLQPHVYAKVAGESVLEILPFEEIVGPLEPGETKRGVAVFRGVDPAADLLTVYVSGLTGDFVTRKTEEGGVKVLYRTYRLLYRRPGDAYLASVDPVTLVSSEWVWR